MSVSERIYRWPEQRDDADVRARLTPADAALPDHVVHAVREILEQVRTRGDDAVLEYGRRFDGADLTPETLRVEPEAIARSAAKAPPALCAAIERAIDNVRAFHSPQRPSSYSVPAPGGGELSLLWRPVESAALYVPGGRAAYPSTVIMNAVPAQVAGVSRVMALTVPGMVEDNPAVARAIQALGIEEVYRVAGAQGVAAAAFGTRTIPSVDVIVGPGNAYVAAAKREVYGRVGIDSVAGPSEVLILADESVDPAWVAQDLIAQAEHDPLARCVLASTSEPFLRAVHAALAARLDEEPRAAIVREAWRDHGLTLLAPDVEALVELTNAMGPEHLQVMLQEPVDVARLTAGAIFVGKWAPTAAGDYIAGPNHVLPTGGTSRFSGPLGVLSFMRPTSVLRATEAMMAELAEPGAAIADYEQLAGHARALRLRGGGR